MRRESFEITAPVFFHKNAFRLKLITLLLLCFVITFMSILIYVLVFFIVFFLSARVHLSDGSLILPFFSLNPFQ
jgi:hypothetical protein